MMDYNNIKQQFAEVIDCSQGIENPRLDSLFEQWGKGKSRFIDKWGGLTYELDEVVTFNRTKEDKSYMLTDFINFAQCLVPGGNSEQLKYFLTLQSIDGFFENRVTHACEINGNKICAGSKISKSLKFFFENSESDNEKRALDTLQTNMSRLIQDCKITGKLVMSVHPLDFISSAENAHNWRSCHALDGEYRGGNLSYMVDEHTFMIYLKADKDYLLPNFPFKWNSKKWRVLMFMSKDEKIIVKGKEYPFTNDYALDLATEKFLGKFYDLSGFSKWTNVDGRIYSIMEDGIGTLHYNDCLNSPSYTPLAIYDLTIENDIYEGDCEHMVIGDAVQCLECESDYVSCSCSMSCNKCGGFVECEYCERAMEEGEGYELQGSLVCPGCWDEYSQMCCLCETVYNCYDEQMTWSETAQMYVCENCYSQNEG